jgi:histidinol-phosphate aminotransferase
MTDIDNLVRENVRNLTPYSCARDDYKGRTGIFMDANENPFGTFNRYPDPYQKELKAALSEFRGIPEEKIFLGNGSDEIIDLCFRVFCNPGSDRALAFTPTYGMYEVSASVNDVEVIKVPLNENFQIDMEKTEPHLSDRKVKLIFICSPNNPTGNAMNFKDVESLVSRFGGVVVIDEAYIDFSDKPSFVRLIDSCMNLIVMQTFSKAFGLAAARVGIAYTNPAIVHYFNRIKPPYNISTINQKTALAKLGKTGEYRSQVKKILGERERLARILPGMKNIEKVYPSDANFLLVRVKDAGSIYNSLIEKGIIVRNRSSVVSNCIRITVGKRMENDKLIDALDTLMI